jgi:hypothetical protein
MSRADAVVAVLAVVVVGALVALLRLIDRRGARPVPPAPLNQPPLAPGMQTRPYAQQEHSGTATAGGCCLGMLGVLGLLVGLGGFGAWMMASSAGAIGVLAGTGFLVVGLLGLILCAICLGSALVAHVIERR